MRWLGTVANQAAYCRLGGHVPTAQKAHPLVEAGTIDDTAAYLKQAVCCSALLDPRQIQAASFHVQCMPLILRCLRGGLDTQQAVDGLVQVIAAGGGLVED
jgi:hypothetical protein